VSRTFRTFSAIVAKLRSPVFLNTMLIRAGATESSWPTPIDGTPYMLEQSFRSGPNHLAQGKPFTPPTPR
jgi:hypothetical protein